MKRLLTILALLFTVVANSQTTNFSFTAIPITTEFIAPGRGAHLWNNRDAPFGTIHIPVSGSPQESMDYYFRFSFSHFFSGIGSDSTFNWTFFDARMNEAIDKRQGIRIRVMGLCNFCGNPPNDNFNNQVNYDGGWQVVPKFLHDLQQAEPVAANRDYFSTFGGAPNWVANVNSPQFQRWVRKLSQNLQNHINTTSHNGVLYRDALRIYDLGYYGCYSEQHSNCLCNSLSDGNIPVGARPTAASLIEIADAQMDYFGASASGAHSNWKAVVPFNAFDAMWLGHTLNPVAYGQWLLDHPDSIGIINDHIGAVEGYDDDYWDLNGRMGSIYQWKLNNRWRYSPTGGEPVGWGSPADRSGIIDYVIKYHFSWFGNGNLDHITNSFTTEANNIRTASRLAGYRLRLTGGSAVVNSTLTINLNWLNEGNAPNYENWNVQYLIKNGAGTIVSTLNSNFQIRYFQPSSSATTHTQAFGIPAIPAGNYGLYVRVVDPTGYRRPMPLAVTPQQSDGSYFMGNITISTGGTNQPPTVNAGSNQSITASSTSVTATASDPDGTIASYQWSRVSGPNTPTIVSPTSASTNITGLIAGVYVFNITVADNNGATASDDVQITVQPNAPPVANAGSNKVISLPTTTTSLTGSGSDDIAVVAYQWSMISGPTPITFSSPTTANTNVSNLTVAGVYTVRLTVTDGSGLTGTDDATITVNAGNQPPIANAGPDQTIQQPTAIANLSGSLSTDEGVLTYEWTQVGGDITTTILTPTSVTTTVTGLSQIGFYIYRLRVTDAQGLSTTDDVQVQIVAAGNTAPVAAAGPNVTLTLPTNFTQLNGTGSTDNIGIVSYLWTKISGPATFSISAPNNAITNIESLQLGVYVFRLTVTDGGGLSSFDDVTVTVLPAANAAPIANGGGNKSITLPTSTTSFDGSASSDDVGIVNYLWTQISGPATATIATPGASTTNISGLTIAGTYLFRLRVEDAGSLFDTDDVTVTVNPATNNAPVSVITTGTPSIQLPTNSINLSGTSSTDDVAIVGYVFFQYSGPSQATIATPTASSTNITNLVAGIYFFKLQVTDGGGLQDTDMIQITVLPATPSRPILNNHSLIRGGLKFLPRNY